MTYSARKNHVIKGISWVEFVVFFPDVQNTYGKHGGKIGGDYLPTGYASNAEKLKEESTMPPGKRISGLPANRYRSWMRNLMKTIGLYLVAGMVKNKKSGSAAVLKIQIQSLWKTLSNRTRKESLTFPETS